MGTKWWHSCPDHSADRTIRHGPYATVVRSALFGMTCVIAAGSVPLSAGREPAVDTALYPVNAVVLGLAGLLIGLRLPRHRIGLLLVGLGLLAGATELVEGYGYHDGWTAALGFAVGLLLDLAGERRHHSHPVGALSRRSGRRLPVEVDAAVHGRGDGGGWPSARRSAT